MRAIAKTTLAIVTAAFGAHGENLLPPRPPLGAPPSDVKLYDSPSFVSWQTRYLTEVFTQGPEGYVDDRLADANGWSTFDVTRITCPVAVLHGTADTLVPVANAYHTASIVPGATLHIVDELGHLSIVTETVALVTDLLARSATR
jgi:pimeloyl-ACP methyl ester carboxylesterase